MMLDPAVLCMSLLGSVTRVTLKFRTATSFPYQRILNYWTKASLFANPVLKQVLLSSGNIPVDRKSKDNRVLFKGTFDVLSEGEAVALFPEGTSYTEPRIMQVKDGASWAALEYMKWAKENPDKVKSEKIVIVPVGIVYTNKSKYRSEVRILSFCLRIQCGNLSCYVWDRSSWSMPFPPFPMLVKLKYICSHRFGEPISISDYQAQFLDPAPGQARAAVKRLTQRIEEDLTRFTINAPDWCGCIAFVCAMCNFCSYLLTSQGHTVCRENGSRPSLG